jgi:hypothetical protein
LGREVWNHVAVDGGVEAGAADFRTVHEGEECGIGNGAETFEGVGGGGAVCLGDNLVVDGLVPVAAVVPGCGCRARFLDAAMKKVVGAAAVGEKELALEKERV